jgi:hypothetical protein
MTETSATAKLDLIDGVLARGQARLRATAECECFGVPEERQFVYYGATEPGNMLEPNPECLVHFPTEAPHG